MRLGIKILSDYFKPPFSKRFKINTLLIILFIVGLMTYFLFFHSAVAEREHQYLTKMRNLHYQSQPIIRVSRDLMSIVGSNISDIKVIEENISAIEDNVKKINEINQDLKEIQPPQKFKYLHSLFQEYYNTLNTILNSFLELSRFTLNTNKITTLLEKHPLVTAVRKDFSFTEASSFQKEVSLLRKEISVLETSFKFTGQIRQNLLLITENQIEIVDNFVNFQRLPYEAWLSNIYSKTENTQDIYKNLKDTFINLEKTPEIYENIQKLNEINSKISQTLQLSI